MTTKAAILQALRAKCLDCSCHQPGEVRSCPVTTCALWPYRFGRDPEPSTTRGFARSPVSTSDSRGRAPRRHAGSSAEVPGNKAPCTRSVLSSGGEAR